MTTPALLVAGVASATGIEVSGASAACVVVSSVAALVDTLVKGGCIELVEAAAAASECELTLSELHAATVNAVNAAETRTTVVRVVEFMMILSAQPIETLLVILASRKGADYQPFGRTPRHQSGNPHTVSYTHLTLPTIYSV